MYMLCVINGRRINYKHIKEIKLLFKGMSLNTELEFDFKFSVKWF